jgi:hypothetical protein
VFGNRVLRRIFGPNRKEVMGSWRRLHNEERRDLYVSPNVIRVIKSRRMRSAGHVTRVVEIRLLGRHTHTLEDNIRMEFREIGCEYVDCIHMTEIRDQWLALNLLMNFGVPEKRNLLNS